MMTIAQLMEYATNRDHFRTLKNYEDFARAFIDFAAGGLQARIVCQNETNYRFFQYRQDGSYNISRPVNTDLFLAGPETDAVFGRFAESFGKIKDGSRISKADRAAFVRAVYTMQQSIGAALDALPAARANQAKKMNGDLFEHLVRLLFRESGADCRSGSISVPVPDDNGRELFRMNYQHDLVIRGKNGEIGLLGSVKTSSKDRIDKIFVDKMLFNRLTGNDTPYIAVFLNDVQRAKTKAPDRFQINSTFLTGHFKAYSIRLASLDGVFYCDLRPAMRTDPFLSERIKPLDNLFFDELPERKLILRRTVRKANRKGANA